MTLLASACAIRPNWVAEVVENELIRVRSADGTLFVLVQPFFARDGEAAAGKVGGVPTKLATVLPGAMVSNVQQVSYPARPTRSG